MNDVSDRCNLLLPRPRRISLTGGTSSRTSPVSYLHEDNVQPQGYRLRISSDSIQIASADKAGQFYALATLKQLKTLFPEGLPQLSIDDWPDFPNRGVMLDISRDKVPTMSTLLSIIDELASLKINQLQLYTEHTFAYRDHEVAWKGASPLTSEDVVLISEYCNERFIELVPNQNSFGHMERWLKHEQYRHLAESPDGSIWPDGTKLSEPFSLCPTDSRSIELIDGLYNELLPNFTSQFLNVGCDETFDLGQPGTRSEEICRTRGRHVVYLDFLKQIHLLCSKYNRRMMFWGDIILEAPELISQLPKDAIALEWGYEASHPFRDRLEKLASAGIQIYVCPGTSTWLTFAGRTQNAIDNLTSAAEAGLQNGAIGFLNTDWGDWGHLQYWPISYLPLAYGAGVSWCLDSNRRIDVSQSLNHFIFLDPKNKTAQLFRDLGNVYQTSKQVPNSTLLFRILQKSEKALEKALDGVDILMLEEQQRQITQIASRLGDLTSQRVDAELIAKELQNTIAMMNYAANCGRFFLGDTRIKADDLKSQLDQIIQSHEQLWLARNRPGGLTDSISRLQKSADIY